MRKAQIWVRLFMWCQTAVNVVPGLSSARCTGHLSAFLTPSPPHPSPHVPHGREAISEETRASRMAAVRLIMVWRKMVKKGRGRSQRWGCHGESSRVDLTLTACGPRGFLYAAAWQRLLFLFTLLNSILLWSRVSCLNESGCC